MGATKKSEARLEFRLPSEQRAVIERAAAVNGQSISEFSVSSLVRVAADVLERHESVLMSRRDRDRFLRLLESAPAPNAALRGAAKRHREKR